MLRHDPAAVAGHAAIRLAVPDWRHHRGDHVIAVQLDSDRHVTRSRGLEVQRVTGWAGRLHPTARPVRLRIEPRSLPSGAVLVDCDYAPYLLRVELDGRLFHDSASARDADLQRDLETAAGASGSGHTTVRLGYGQVYDRACATAGHLATLLRGLGWDGAPTACDRCRDAA